MASPVPSVKTLRAAFPALTIAAVKSLREACEVATDNGGDRQLRAALGRANAIIGGYGIEYIRENDVDCRDGIDYVNMGDTYATTILFDRVTGLVRVCSWGDYVESLERRGRHFA